ncbi:hypothetical protein [Hymenobacter sp. BRD128]|uniref:hypothetical protein n=1 Tax=Hymenobacter sp. BRD128 TaxID=2675878 RepID=UPI0020B680BD|nr:hypothetical protein [Hymenobacter sp. BRD128]
MRYAVVLWAGLATVAGITACTQLPMESNVVNAASLRATTITARPPDSAGYVSRPPATPTALAATTKAGKLPT